MVLGIISLWAICVILFMGLYMLVNGIPGDKPKNGYSGTNMSDPDYGMFLVIGSLVAPLGFVIMASYILAIVLLKTLRKKYGTLIQEYLAT